MLSADNNYGEGRRFGVYSTRLPDTLARWEKPINVMLAGDKREQICMVLHLLIRMWVHGDGARFKPTETRASTSMVRPNWKLDHGALGDARYSTVTGSHGWGA